LLFWKHLFKHFEEQSSFPTDVLLIPLPFVSVKYEQYDGRLVVGIEGVEGVVVVERAVDVVVLVDVDVAVDVAVV